MKTIQKHALAAVLGLGLTTSAALAQANGPDMPKEPMQGMMGGDMQGMMQMMQAMGPMMEACTDMMQQMAHHQPAHPDSATPPADQDTTTAPEGG
ncbi:hypothetical protein [Nisaea denitrificans]|jgi:hypothetical protein|uniref:hypothetical protein n=1 Tax=Nisaea denitrificans TaxID=390877 RepID=UPI00041FB05E|nr:hypothetical protein [Nisaea denitrificans]|tara:strand:+ start:11476 stop:11760 length:285 start_codon:yes stop_codon:yes gene_type:complete